MNARKFYEVAGIRLAAIASNIRYADRLDLVLIEIARGAAVAGVYTQNAFCAAPVLLAKQHLQTATSRYFLINTGNANAGTGAAGRDDAFRCCQALAELTEVQACSVLPFSTGVIGEPLPVDKIVFGLPEAIDKLSASNWLQAATGILTTDTRPKLASTRLELDGKSVTITGMAKGSGMIKPDMATMLAFVFTDAQIHQQLLEQKLAQAVSHSFNRITVDGDTSTNDSCMLAATGHSQVQIDAGNKSVNEKFDRALGQIFQELATGLIRDAEGATKFITINVRQGASTDECLQVAYTVAESPLVKTAFFASDPNWGRILAAVGRSGLKDLSLDAIAITLGDLALISNGELDPNYAEEKAQIEMDKQEITIDIKLARGRCSETVWTSDLSHDYVKINAEYRT
ncbi:MAG: bifunctional glutamate N-acetyltransferase/amino-acid acetyltransferase ArgJ [Pseudohongiellaceae bacterium]|jgi:glutamate N-acetyltransferase/amino-acid N-acetyltransferase